MLTDHALSSRQRAESFHSSMAASLVRQALAIAARHTVRRVGLAGGVFQNRVLTRQVVDGLEANGFSVFLGALLPTNDAALSFGQAAEMAARDDRRG
jgi:hydrogenase maturation protein HypF